MEFEWDEIKRQQNLDKHGVDFLYAALMFENPILTVQDTRRTYSEVRFVSLGIVGGAVYSIVHTQRNENIRIISAWKGGRKEYEQYKNCFP